MIALYDSYMITVVPDAGKPLGISRSADHSNRFVEMPVVHKTIETDSERL